MNPIVSVRDLARRLGTPIERLRAVSDEIATRPGSHYLFWSETDPKTGKVRQLKAPRPELKEIQRRIARNILRKVPLSDSAHGGVRGRSPLSNASMHLGQALVVTMDVKSFYPSVRHYVVFRLFRHELGFGRDVASLLTRLTTVDAQLPQGAPTSTAIANILLTSAVDSPVSRCAWEVGAKNTRFVDDFSFSGRGSTTLIEEAARALSQRRLSIWRRPKSGPSRKLRIMPRSVPQKVTGLNVNSRSGPSVPQGYRDGVRAAIHQLQELPEDRGRGSAEDSIRGRLLYIERTNPGAACRLRRYLERQTKD